MNEVRASVAMAVYNGEKYICEQIDSILSLLGSSDELVISYDKCTDNTVSIISNYAQRDARIRVLRNELRPGVSGNFTNAVRNTRGKYVFLSDQDDLWLNNKIELVVTEMEKTKADLVIHNGRFADNELEPIGVTLFETTKATKSPLLNLYKGRFLGCCMCFRRECFKYILPFPDITSDFPHDVFATILVGLKGKIVLLDDICIYHRLHDSNATPKTRNSVRKVVNNRLLLLRTLIPRALIKKDKINEH